MPTLIRRGVESILLFGFVVTLTFVLAHLAPGDATDLLVPPSATADDIANLRARFGLDGTLAEQYVRWASRVLVGDLGDSFALAEPVRDVIARALPVTLALGVVSLLLTFGLGIAMGFWQARRVGTWPDRLVGALSLTVYAAPSFWLALALVAVFTYVASRQGWPAFLRLPAMGMRSPGAGTTSLADLVRHAVLPVTVLAAVGAAGLARYARATAIALLETDWVRTARAKGGSTRVVLYRHVLANARPTLIVLLALSLPGVVAGSVFVESIFAWPGMGRVLLSSIAARDYPVVMGATLVYAAMVIASNWLADLGIAWADPRRR